MVIVLLGLLAIVAIPKYYDLQSDAKLAAEKGVVGAVRSGIYTYFVKNKAYPATLDSATLAVCSVANMCFGTVLDQDGVTSGWTKTDSLTYQGPAENTYTYKPSDGSFLPGAAPLVSSDFDSGVATGWATTMGSAVVQDGQYVLSGGQARAFTGDPSWSDYIIETDATLIQGAGYGVFFRVTNASSLTGYSFQYDVNWMGGTFIMRQWTGGHEAAPFAMASPPPGFQWTGTERQVKLNVSGNTFTAFIDGQQVLTGTNSAYSSGQVGLRTWTNSSASFDNFEVTAAPST
jgi:type II secretory pathway pseudopilin PulG